MPEVIVELAEGRTLDQKREIVKGITDTIERVCGVDREAVVVIIHETPRQHKARGGKLFIDR
ncbi:MAG: 2-hydroxymuconate tautomerase family protein [Chloroflexota bacterium]